jgi:YVTN family beta-propeller protein
MLRAMRRLLAVLLPLVVVVAGGAFAIAQLDKTSGRIGPDTKIQPTGRKLDPAGRTTGRLGNLPVGGSLTTNGRYLWTLSGGRGNNDIRIVAVDPPSKCRKGRRGTACRNARLKKVARVVQTLPMPGLSGGIVMHRDNRTAYVSGVQESKHKDQAVPDSVPGQKGDVIHVFRYDGRTGQATRDGVIAVPPPSGAPVPQNFPPKTSGTTSWPQDLALSRDGGTLLVALNLADHAAVVDTKTKAVRYVKTGTYPRGAAITHDGKRGLVSNEADGTVSVIDLETAKVVKTIRVGPNLSHPQAIATDPKSERAYVAVTHQDLIAVLNTEKLEVERTISVSLPQGLGTAPVGLSLTRDGRRLLVSNSGEDAVAVVAIPQEGSDFTVAGGARASRLTARAETVLAHEGRRGLDQAESEDEEAAEKLGEEAEEKAEAALAKKPVRARPKDFSVIGRIPTGSYPVGAWATPGSKHLVWLSAKGLGVGPNPRGPSPLSKDDSDDAQGQYQYLPREVFGNAGILRFPSDARTERYTPRAARALRPTNAVEAPPGSPIAGNGPSQKIKHVFYVVRENRTYDQVLGDDERGDGDPKLTLFGPDVTPNAHALAKRFPLLDHVFANSEASIDGHFWTSAAAVSDYVTRAWHQNYGGRGRPYDFGVYSVTWPAAGFLFDRAEAQGIDWFNFGEAVAGTVPLPDKNRGDAETDQVTRKFAKSDLGQNGCFPNDASSGGIDEVYAAAGQDVEVFDSSLPAGARPGAMSRFECFRNRFNGWLATNSVPQFVYATFANDHTAGTRPGRRTPKAMVAENDYALGQIVDLISKSPIWKESAILVIEDDSQNGADHVDAHRIPAFVISPYAKEGAVVHTRYDFLSFIRTLEVITGMKPLNLFDTLAVPLYDAFNPDPSNDKPYDVIKPKQAIDERNPATAPNAQLSEELAIGRTDQTPQRILDRIVWQSVHGAGSEPPPPGPNASELDNEAARQLGLDPATGKRTGPAKEREDDDEEEEAEAEEEEGE